MARQEQRFDDESIGLWVYDTCVLFGAMPATAHLVAAAFVAGLRHDAITPPRRATGE